MLFLAAVAHGLIIPWSHLPACRSGTRAARAGLESPVLSRRGSRSGPPMTRLPISPNARSWAPGNTREAVAPRNRASSVPIPQQDGTVTDGNALAPKGDAAGARTRPRADHHGAGRHRVQYLADEGSITSVRTNVRRCSTSRHPMTAVGPEDDQGPALQLPGGPKRDELWTTPIRRAADARALPRRLASGGAARRRRNHSFPSSRGAHAGCELQANPVIEVGYSRAERLTGWRRSSSRSSRPESSFDNAAFQTLKLAAPFDPLPPDPARQHQVLRVLSTNGSAHGRGERQQPFLEPAAGSSPYSAAHGRQKASRSQAFRESAASPFAEKCAQTVWTSVPAHRHAVPAQTPTLRRPWPSSSRAHRAWGALGIVLTKPLPRCGSPTSSRR